MGVRFRGTGQPAATLGGCPPDQHKTKGGTQCERKEQEGVQAFTSADLPTTDPLPGVKFNH
jgi:hypothetical protein